MSMTHCPDRCRASVLGEFVLALTISDDKIRKDLSSKVTALLLAPKAAVKDVSRALLT